MLRRTFLRALPFFLAFPAALHADAEFLGTYSPAAFGRAGMNGTRAVLVHVVAGFCSSCARQKEALTQSYPMYPGIGRHLVTMDLEMETWRASPLLKKHNVTAAGEMLLFRGDELLAQTRATSVEEISAFLAVVQQQPDWAPPPAPPAP